MIVFVASDTSLLRMCFFGTIPARCKRVINTRYALASSWLFLLVMGLTEIALLSISTSREKPVCLVGEYLFHIRHILA